MGYEIEYIVQEVLTVVGHLGPAVHFMCAMDAEEHARERGRDALGVIAYQRIVDVRTGAAVHSEELRRVGAIPAAVSAFVDGTEDCAEQRLTA